jgi:hypothetical protein
VDEDPVGEAAAGIPKTLAFYELDLGLNHVVRKSSEEVSPSANLLITVPGGDAGPSGVLVCAENKISCVAKRSLLDSNAFCRVFFDFICAATISLVMPTMFSPLFPVVWARTSTLQSSSPAL